MGEPKTVPTDASVDDFLHAATPARRREDGLRLAGIFREVTGADPVLWGPSIVGYGSYRYVSPANPRTRGEWPKTGFSPRKAAISLYGLQFYDGDEERFARLGKHKMGKSCLYFKRLADLDAKVLEALIAGSVAEIKRRHPDA